jgi:23S rRNA (cytosine1962-C5)-methyltransferase
MQDGRGDGAASAYKLLDSGHFQKLEQVGPYRFVRPAAQAVWRPRLDAAAWADVDAVFTRFSGGDGKWEVKNKRLPGKWTIATAVGKLVIELTDFGHLGIFPEQHANWQRLEALIRSRVQAGATAAGGAFSVLNLFAYTGGSSLAAAKGGAHVAHVDASKTSVNWARANAEASGLADRPIRWLVDDVQKFVARELRRDSRYHGIILDPPSYGRGPKGETWKIEDHLLPMLDDLRKILAPDYAFILLSAHSTGYTPLALRNVLSSICDAGEFAAEEMTVTEDGPNGRPLPSGASCLFIRSI